MDSRNADSAQTQKLLEAVRQGTAGALNRLLARHRPFLEQFVALRLDAPLRPRIDPSDVVQEAQMDAINRLEEYLRKRPLPFRLWLRQLTQDRLAKARRFHVAAARRSVNRESPLENLSALRLADKLIAKGPTASGSFNRQELAHRLWGAMAELAKEDREILLLRSLEGLSYSEIACLTDTDAAAARKRHGRALLRLHRILFVDGITEAELT